MPKEELCFVIMPFEEKMSELYFDGIKPAVEAMGLKCVRADEVDATGNIVRRIVEYIAKARVIIAVLTGRNPNVFYELGTAHTLGNNTIVLAQHIEEVPFDVKAYQVIVYKDTIGGGKLLQTKIKNQIQTIEEWSNKSNNPVQDFLPEKPVSPEAYNTKAGELESVQAKLSNAQKDLLEYENLKWAYDELRQKYEYSRDKEKELEILHKLLGPSFMDGRKTSQEGLPEFINSVKNVMERVQTEGEVSINVASTQDDGKKKKIKFTKIN